MDETDTQKRYSWRRANRERWNAYMRKWRAEHPASADEKEARREYSRAYRSREREATNTYAREWYRKNRDRLLAKARAKAYGVTEVEYSVLPGAATNRCAICGVGPSSESPHGFVRALCLDHNHRTGRPRGILCNSCNSMIANAQDDPARLRAAIAYLEAAV